MKGQLKITLFILATIFIVVMSFTQNEVLKDIISIVIAAYGVIAIFYQLKKEKDIAEGSFILELNNTFGQDEGIKTIYTILKQNIDNKKYDYLKEEHRSAIDDYLTFFETIYTMYKKRIFSISEIDEMFAFRFFLIINNPLVRTLELDYNVSYYNTLYELYVDWEAYRLKKNKEIFNNEYSFKDYYEASVK